MYTYTCTHIQVHTDPREVALAAGRGGCEVVYYVAPMEVDSELTDEGGALSSWQRQAVAGGALVNGGEPALCGERRSLIKFILILIIIESLMAGPVRERRSLIKDSYSKIRTVVSISISSPLPCAKSAAGQRGIG